MSLPLALKRGKIMLSRQNCGGSGHGRQVQGRSYPPGVVAIKRRAVSPVEDAVLVGLGPGRFSGVKRRLRLSGRKHRNIPGQQGVQPFMEGREGDGAGGAEIGHLAPGVDPGVGAPRADEGHLFTGKTLQSLFQSLLDGGGISLPLPAVIARSRRIPGKEADVADEGS